MGLLEPHTSFYKKLIHKKLKIKTTVKLKL